MTRLGFCLCVAACLHAQTIVTPWSGYGHDPQHTGLSTIGAQRLERVKWSTPVDLVLANSPGDLYIHYGSVTVTAGNTALVPVRTSTANTYRVEAHSGSSGALLYTLATDYTPPPHDWIPSYAPALSRGSRLYYPGAGGTVYYRDQPDSVTGPSGQIAFFGNALYAANATAFNGAVMISTPITADSAGNIYFGFDVLAPNPANLTSGLARIGADGSGTWISASAAAQGDATIQEVALNCAPALSNDGSRLYFAVSSGPVGTGASGGYLVSVNSATLAPIARVRLTDPSTGQDAELLDDSSASPTVGPDGDVYYGVFESQCCINDDRGWLLHFDANLAQSKTPGAFGWDTTASVVPASLVPSYHGASSYLLFTKYNNYLGVGPGGNGLNKIAVLDPNAAAADPITGAQTMQVVIAMLGQTLDPPGNTSGSVHEWCINSGAIDPFAAAAIANSEDGVVYHWDFASNSFTQQVRLTSGVGEAYTPTAIGADGAAYAINDANLFAVGQAANLTITSSHAGNFTPGQTGAAYILTVTNSGTGATSGIVTVADIVPAGLTASTISGQGWNCTQPAGPCVRSDSLAVAASYPVITLSVNVAAAPPASVTNIATVSSDGAVNSVNATAADATTIIGGSAVPIVIQTNPAGLQIVVDGAAPVAAPQSYSWQPGSSHTIGVISPQSAGPGAREIFTAWSDSGAQSHTIVIPAVAANYIASFTAQYQLTTAASPSAGGTVIANPPSPDGYYNAGVGVQLTASPNVGYSFASWAGDLSGSLDPQSIAMNAAHSVTANFSAACTLTLSPSSASLPATGTAAVAACPNAGQPTCGFYPETPQSFTVIPSGSCGVWTATSSDTEFLEITTGALGSGTAPVSFAAFVNSHASSRGAAITVASGAASAIFTVAEAGSGDNQAYRQVYALYERILGRDPDSSGFAFWTGQGAAGLGQMADSFLTSAEAFNTAFAVVAVYQAVAGAPPSFAQYAAAVGSIRSGAMTVNGLFNTLAGASFPVAPLYQNLLNRQPTGAETTAFNSNGAWASFQSIVGYPAGASPVSASNNEFQSTGTFHTDHTNALYVGMLYLTILARDPDPGGFSFWLSVANSGGPGLLFQAAAGYSTRIQIVGTGVPLEGFVGSPEFQSLFAN